MKTIKLSFILIFLLSFNPLSAQENSPCPCCTDNHKAFDFWVGNWTVFNTEGKVVGTNKIVKMQNGCVLQENWRASNNKNTGTSYNFYDKSDSTWNQIWISNTGNILRLKGNLNEDRDMVLRSKLIDGKKGKYYNQITWTENDDNSVTQHWVILNEDYKKIADAFTGIYRKNSDRD